METGFCTSCGKIQKYDPKFSVGVAMVSDDAEIWRHLHCTPLAQLPRLASCSCTRVDRAELSSSMHPQLVLNCVSTKNNRCIKKNFPTPCCV